MRKLYGLFFDTRPLDGPETQILEAAKKKDWASVDRLLSFKQNVMVNEDKCTVWHYAAADAENKILQKLISLNIKGVHHRDINGNSATHYAVIYSNVKGLEILLNCGENTIFIVNNRRESVLHIAAKKGNTSMLVLIMGALKNMRQKLDNPDQDGNTALHLAVLNGHVEAVQLLLEQGASLNVLNNAKQTPAALAALKFPAKLELGGLLAPEREALHKGRSTTS